VLVVEVEGKVEVTGRDLPASARLNDAVGQGRPALPAVVYEGGAESGKGTGRRIWGD